MNLLKKMQEESMFSDSEQEIVRFLLMNPTENLTVRELAERTYTSCATIVRMCRKLGYDGYRQFKVEFIKEMESRKYLIETVDYNQPFHGEESVQDIIRNMGMLYKESTDLFLQSLDGKNVEQISKTILEARRIYIYAVGDSMITARAFANKLLKLDIYPILACEFGEGTASSYNVTKNDCAIFLSYSLRHADFKRCFKILRDKQVPVITITANEKHVITKLSAYKLLIPGKEEEFKIATFYSQFAFSFLCDIIYSTIYAQNYQYYSERKQEIDGLGRV